MRSSSNKFFQFFDDRDFIPNQTIFAKDKYVGANGIRPRIAILHEQKNLFVLQTILKGLNL
jgi:hypothetical protein